MNKFVILINLSLFSCTLLASGAGVNALWDSYPVSFTVSTGDLLDYEGNVIPKNDLISAFKDWNNVRSNNPVVVVSPGCTDGDRQEGICTGTRVESVGFCSRPENAGDPLCNGVNEIELSHISSYVNLGFFIGATRALLIPSSCMQDPDESDNTPRKGCVETITGADVIMNSSANFNFFTGSPPSLCNSGTFANAIEIIKHEAGHAIGLGHVRVSQNTINQPILRPIAGGCNNVVTNISSRDKALYNDVFFENTVEVSILNPIQQQIVPVGTANFVASVSNQFFNGLISPENFKSTNTSPLWRSSVDGELGQGDDINVFLRTIGEHTITATVTDPQHGGDVSGVVNIIVTDQTQELANLGPIPCIRLAGDPERRCLLEFSSEITSDLCSNALSFDHSYESVNEATNEDFPIVVTTNRTGSCSEVRAHTWLTSPDSVLFNYRFTHRFGRSGSTSVNTSHSRGNLNFADTNISFSSFEEVCDLTVNNTCQLNFTWNDHFFDVGTAIFKRRTENDDWVYVERVSGETGQGQITLGTNDIGSQIAVFQYGEDHGFAPNRPFSQGPVIRAPTGLLRGPNEIQFVLSSQGTLTTDSPCTVSPGQTQCTVTLNSTHANTPMTCLWRTSTGGAPSRRGCTFGGATTNTYMWPSARPNQTEVFELRAHNALPANTASGHASGVLLDSESITASSNIGPSGTLLTDSPCTVSPGQAECTVTLNSTHANTPMTCLWRTSTGGTPSRRGCTFGGATTNTYTWPSARPNRTEVFELRAHNALPANTASGYASGVLLDTESITASSNNGPSGTLVTDSPCTVNPGETQCTVTLNSTHANTPMTCLWRTSTGGAPSRRGCTFGGATTNTYTWPSARPNRTEVFELRAHNALPANTASGYASGVLLDTESITGL